MVLNNANEHVSPVAGAILKTSIDFPRREDLSGDHHDDDEQNYDFLVNWMGSGEFSEGGMYQSEMGETCVSECLIAIRYSQME